MGGTHRYRGKEHIVRARDRKWGQDSASLSLFLVSRRSQQIADNIIVVVVDAIVSSDLATQLAATQCLQVRLQHRHRASLVMLVLMAMQWRWCCMCGMSICRQLSR